MVEGDLGCWGGGEAKVLKEGWIVRAQAESVKEGEAAGKVGEWFEPSLE